MKVGVMRVDEKFGVIMMFGWEGYGYWILKWYGWG